MVCIYILGASQSRSEWVADYPKAQHGFLLKKTHVSVDTKA